VTRPNAASYLCAASALTVLVLALPGCTLPNRVSVAPGATRDSLVFVIAGETGSADMRVVYGLTVQRCAGDLVFWTIVGNGTTFLPDRVRYGQAVPGFAATAGPVPLSAGCYRVIVSAAPPVTFDVGPDGVVRLRQR